MARNSARASDPFTVRHCRYAAHVFSMSTRDRRDTETIRKGLSAVVGRILALLSKSLKLRGRLSGFSSARLEP